MTDKQPDALRLADELESCRCLADESIYDNAAAELRRLHAETINQRDRLAEMNKSEHELRRLQAENQALKDLCKRSLRALDEYDFPMLRDELRQATKEEEHNV